MMKWTYFLIALLTGTISFVSAQNIDEAKLEVDYRVLTTNDLAPSSRPKEDFTILLVGKKTNKYYSYNTFKVDSVVDVLHKSGQDNNLPLALAHIRSVGKRGATHIIFQGYPSGQNTVLESILKDKYQYSEPNKMVWTMDSQKKTILGHIARRAFTDFSGRHYTAWFAEDIPVNAGPWKFIGLPGLILQAQDKDGYFVWDCVGLKPNIKKPIEIDLRDRISSKKKDFLRLKNNYDRDPLAYINTNTGMTIKQNAGGTVVHQRSLNPVELGF